MNIKEEIQKGFTNFLETEVKVLSISPTKPKEEDIFIDLITTYKMVTTSSNKLMDDYDIDLFGYESNYHKIIENLIYYSFGEDIYHIIMFYIHGKEEFIEEWENIHEDQYKLLEYTPKQLYQYLKKNYEDYMK